MMIKMSVKYVPNFTHAKCQDLFYQYVSHSGSTLAITTGRPTWHSKWKKMHDFRWTKHRLSMKIASWDALIYVLSRRRVSANYSMYYWQYLPSTFSAGVACNRTLYINRTYDCHCIMNIFIKLCSVKECC